MIATLSLLLWACGTTPAPTKTDAGPACVDATDCEVGVCHPTQQVCVQCASDTDCPAGVCHPEANVCVQCLDDQGCPAGVCHPDTAFCVQCVEDSHCDGGHCHPDLSQCVECVFDDNCLSGHCNAEVGVCIGCVTDGDCEDNDPCTEAVCEAEACVYSAVECCPELQPNGQTHTRESTRDRYRRQSG